MGATGDVLKVIGFRFSKVFTTPDVYCGPLSLISTFGIPNLEKMESKVLMMLTDVVELNFG